MDVDEEKPGRFDATPKTSAAAAAAATTTTPTTGTQFLHCLELDAGVKDGATMFMDAFAAAEHFRDHFPEKFEVCVVSICECTQKSRWCAVLCACLFKAGGNRADVSVVFVDPVTFPSLAPGSTRPMPHPVSS